jgi:hypothetical protein
MPVLSFAPSPKRLPTYTQQWNNEAGRVIAAAWLAQVAKFVGG